jgi:hypothetical protein
MSDGPTNPMDLQDPLPEANWLWRRVFCFAVVAVLMFFVYGSVDRLGRVAILSPAQGIPALVTVTKSILFLAMLTITYYLLAPSAEQLTKLVKTASLLKSGVQMASRTIMRPDKTETATTVGLPPAPPVPPAVESPTPATPEPVSVPDGLQGPDSGASQDDDDEPERSPPADMPDEVTSDGGKA